MFTIDLTTGTPEFYLLVVFISVFVIQQAFYWIMMARLAFSKNGKESRTSGGVSVVICARNEHDQLKNNLPLILDQDYPDFEVVVVNWASDDDSAYLLARMSEQDPRLKIVEIKENLNFFSGKKFPLSIGIKSAKNEKIVVTNADARPASRNWISLMSSGFMPATEVLLGYGAYEKKNGLLNRLVRYDTAVTAFRYLSFALAGIPYMGVGRNMAYLKSLFYENKGFISHYRINPGDDDLFINKVAKKKTTRIMICPESFTISRPPEQFRFWMAQKKRQLSTRRFYRSGHRFLLGLYSISVFLFWLLFILLLLWNYNPVVVVPVFLLRLIIQLVLYYRCFSKLNEQDLIWLVPFFELSMFFIHPAAFISNLFSRNNRWK